MNSAATKTILVTGSAGYIGAQKAYQPIAFDNCRGAHVGCQIGTSRNGRHPRSDCLDRGIEKYHPSASLHFAAFAYVGELISDPGKYYRNNVAGSLTLLEALKAHGSQYMCQQAGRYACHRRRD
jgi:UDP-arabinose 4-epimerase